MSDFVVAKYGGTSMAQPEVVAEVMEMNPEQRLIVVSAPGKLVDSDIKLTPELENYAQLVGGDTATRQQAAESIVDRYDRAYSSLDSKKLNELRDDLYKQLSPDFDKNVSFYKSVGEYASAKYFAELTGGRFLKPDHIHFNTDGSVNTNYTLRSIGENVKIGSRPLITPGYYGYTPNNLRELLGDGGSDRTGAFYASALALPYENWTDQDGIFSADPRVVHTAKLISQLSRNEVREGAHGGSGILQGDTILDLVGSDIEVTVKNTFNPDASGTKILPDRTPSSDEEPVIALSGRKLNRVNVYDIGMGNAHGYLKRIYTEGADLNLSFEHSLQTQDFSSFTFTDKVSPAKLGAFGDFTRANTISSDAVVQIERSGTVYMVGEGLKDPRVKASVFGRVGSKLALNSLGLEDVSDNKKSPSIALHTSFDEVDEIMRVLHNEFIED